MIVDVTTSPTGIRTYTYSSGDVSRYMLVAPQDRTYSGPRYRGEAGAYVGSRWYPAIAVLDDADRVLPETRPDEEAFDHPYGCRCQVCRRPDALYWKRAKRFTRAGARPTGPRHPRP